MLGASRDVLGTATSAEPAAKCTAQKPASIHAQASTCISICIGTTSRMVRRVPVHASGRGHLASARARALMNERTHASFEDVKFVAPSVLRHRIILEYNARVEGLTSNEVISSLLEEVPFQSGNTPGTLQQTSSN